MSAAELGLGSLSTELSDHRPPVEGEIPDWLSGTLIRNGPGLLEVGGSLLNHWFDGLAMLRRYGFEDGEVSYSNRFLRTDAYSEARRGEITGQFGTDTRGWRRLLSWLRSLGPPEGTDNANVHVARVDGEYVALTEAPRRVSFDPVTLGTRGEFRFGDDLPEHLTAAHLVDDPHAEELVGFATEFGYRPRYHVYRVPYGRRRRERIASVEAQGPAYVHDCSVTDSHVVLVETPLEIDALRSLDPSSDGMTDMLRWTPDRDTRILVVDRASGGVTSAEVEPMFTFHHVNAYSEGSAVVLDIVEFPDGGVVDSMSMSMPAEGDRRSGGLDFPEGKPVRYRIDTDTGTAERTQTHGASVELPRVSRSDTGRRHRYAYAQSTGNPRGNGLVRLDYETGAVEEWYEGSVYVEEPVPVRSPDGDDVAVLATGLDVDEGRTVLLVFDAETVTVEARVPLPHAEPFGFHGRFFPEVPGVPD